MPKNIKPIIDNIVNDLKAYDPEKIILYGSYAWGKPHEDSDLDFFVIKKSDEKRIDRVVKLRELIRNEHYLMPMDFLVYTPEEVKKREEIGDLFIQEIFENGRVIYEK